MELSQKFYDPYAHRETDMMPFMKQNREMLMEIMDDWNISVTRLALEVSLTRDSVSRLIALKGFPSERVQELIYDMYGVELITRRNVIDGEYDMVGV